MALEDLRDKTAVVGVGNSRTDRKQEVDPLSYMLEALKGALDDAGLTKEDLDGLMVGTVHGFAGGFMDKLPEVLGLDNITYAFQSWAHGRTMSTCIATAAMAVHAGLAKHVAVITYRWFAPFRQRYQGENASSDAESQREGLGPHLECPPYGNVAIIGGAAFAMQKYLLRYGGAPERLGQVAVAQRQWASMNPNALFYRKPITLEDYLNSRFIIEPLRLLDCSIPANGSHVVLVSSAERARDCRKAPVYLSGFQASASGREHFLFGRTGLGVGAQREAPYRAPEMPVYRMAGVTRGDIDILGAMDQFTPCVLFCLEEFGFCGEGEALQWVQGGRTAPGGELPVNTSGGRLSEFNHAGMGTIVDLVRQLRGEGGERQVPGAEVAPYISGDRCSLIFRT